MFIGKDLYQSGRLAASLNAKMLPDNSRIVVVHVNLESHMLKENGFKDYFKRSSGKYEISSPCFDDQNEKDF